MTKTLLFAATLLGAQAAYACPANLDAILKSAYKWSTPASAVAGERSIMTQDRHHIAVPANVQCRVWPRKPALTIIAVKKEDTTQKTGVFDTLDLLLVDTASGALRHRAPAHDGTESDTADFGLVKLETDSLNSPSGPPMFGVVTSRSSEATGKEYLSHTLSLYVPDGDKLKRVGQRNLFANAPYLVGKEASANRKSCGDKRQDMSTFKPLASTHNGLVDLRIDTRRVSFLCELVDGKEVKTFPTETFSYTLEYDGKQYQGPPGHRY